MGEIGILLGGGGRCGMIGVGGASIELAGPTISLLVHYLRMMNFISYWLVVLLLPVYPARNNLIAHYF